MNAFNTLAIGLGDNWVNEPVFLLAMIMLILLFAPFLARRLRLPGIVGLIIAGIIAGPGGFGVLSRGVALDILGHLGLLYLMFIVAVEIDLNKFKRQKKHSILFGALTFLFPLIVGVSLSRFVLNWSWPASILLASLFASHTLLSYPIAQKLGMSKNKVVMTATGGTILTDTAALMTLVVVAESIKGDNTPLFWIRQLFLFAVFIAAILYLLPMVGRYIFKQSEPDGIVDFSFITASIFLSSFLAKLVGAEPIIGAFLAGFALNRMIPEHSVLMNRVQFVGNALFIPCFLIYVGTLVDVSVLIGGYRPWMIAGFMVAITCITKWCAAWVSGMYLGYTRDERQVLFGLTVNQAAATLAAALIGYELGLLSINVINGTIVMIIVTSLVGAWFTEHFGRKVVVQGDVPVPIRDNNARILVPIFSSTDSAQLIEIVHAIRMQTSSEPVFPLRVILDSENADVDMAAAEKMLADFVVHNAGSDIPITPVIRIDTNLAGAIDRVVREYRITQLVISADDTLSFKRKNAGAVETLIDQCAAMIMMNDIHHPLHTVRRLYILVTPLLHRQVGFHMALAAISRLAHACKAEIILCADTALHSVELPSLAHVTWRFHDDFNWDHDVVPQLKSVLKVSDMLVILASRKGRLAWRPRYEHKIEHIRREFSEFNQSTFYLSDRQVDNDEGVQVDDTLSMGELLSEDHVMIFKHPVDHHDAIRKMFEHAFTAEISANDVMNELAVAIQQPIDLIDGVELIHGHVRDVSSPRLLLLIAKRLFSDDQHATYRCSLLLLGPKDIQPEQHLNLLAMVAKWVQQPGFLEKVDQCESYDDVKRLLI